MRTRPTPEQLAHPDSLARLKAHGYVIVHPDDVLEQDPGRASTVMSNYWALGWNDCCAHIFGAAS